LGGAGGRSGITVTYRGAFAVQCAQWHGDLSASVGGNSDKIIFRNIVGQGQFDCGATKLIFLAIFVGIPSSVDRSGFLNVSHLDGCSSRLWIFCHGVVQRGEVKRHVLACSQRSLGRDTNIGLAFLNLSSIRNVIIGHRVVHVVYISEVLDIRYGLEAVATVEEEGGRCHGVLSSRIDFVPIQSARKNALSLFGRWVLGTPKACRQSEGPAWTRIARLPLC